MADPISEDEFLFDTTRLNLKEYRLDVEKVKDAIDSEMINDSEFCTFLARSVAQLFVAVEGTNTKEKYAQAAVELWAWLTDNSVIPSLKQQAKVDAQAAWDRLQAFQPEAGAREVV